MATSIKNESFLSSAVMTLDKFCDFIPIVSSINNLMILVSKVALSILSAIMPKDTYNSMIEYPLIAYLNEKPISVCVLLVIPFVNILYACIYHYAGPSTSDLPPPQRVSRQETRRQVNPSLPQNLPTANLSVSKPSQVAQVATASNSQASASRQQLEGTIRELQGRIDALKESDPRKALLRETLVQLTGSVAHIDACDQSMQASLRVMAKANGV